MSVTDEYKPRMTLRQFIAFLQSQPAEWMDKEIGYVDFSYATDVRVSLNGDYLEVYE